MPGVLSRNMMAGLTMAGLAACAVDPESPPRDVVPPAAVTDLAVAFITPDSVGLTWTAPGDDGRTGGADRYDLRCAACEIRPEIWGEAVPLSVPVRPAPAGTRERVVIRALPRESTLHAALRAADEAGNWSDLSNRVDLDIPGEIRILLEPIEAEVPMGGTLRLRAVVTGATNGAVTWSVDEGPSRGLVDAGGLYQAPEVLPLPPRATVRATCVADPSVSAAATAFLVLPPEAPPGFVAFPAGAFTMGDGEAWCGRLEHPVRLTEAFHLGQTEVTNAQYLEMAQWAVDHGHARATPGAVTDALDGSTALLLDMDRSRCEIGFSDGEFHLVDAGHGDANGDHPVKGVTWYGAAAYCDWLSLRDGLERAYDHATWACGGGDPYRARGWRLPTSAEWEYAAQYDDERVYPWGDEPPSCERANFCGCNGGWTEPVASQAAGPEKIVGGRGVYDMAGNVWEWCNDWWACESVPAPVDPVGPETGFHRMYRGGAWSSGPVVVLRASARDDRGVPGGCASIIGFRVARTVAP